MHSNCGFFNRIGRILRPARGLGARPRPRRRVTARVIGEFVRRVRAVALRDANVRASSLPGTEVTRARVVSAARNDERGAAFAEKSV